MERQKEQAFREKPSGMKLFRGLLLLGILFVLIDGALPQLQMLLLGGRVIIGLLPLKVFMAISLIGFALYRPRKQQEVLTVVSLAFAGYLLVDILHLWLGLELPAIDLFGGYWVYYSSFLLVFLAGCSALEISEKGIIRFLIFLFFICAAVGIAQYLTGRTLLPTRSSDGSFTVGAVGFLGVNRVFSLFIFPGTFGIFCVFMTGLFLSMPVRGMRFAGWIVLAALASAVCYTTLIRSCYLELIATVFSVAVLRMRPRSLFAPLLPVAGILLGLAVIAKNLLFGAVAGSGVTDSSSFIARLLEWRYYADVAFSGSFVNMMFGEGIVQSERVATGSSVAPVDNIFLSYPLHIGVVGLLLVLAFYVVIWLDLLAKVKRLNRPIDIAVAALWSSTLCLGLYSIDIPAVAAYLLLTYISYPREPSSVKEAFIEEGIPVSVTG
jgi:hypothetical protein